MKFRVLALIALFLLLTGCARQVGKTAGASLGERQMPTAAPTPSSTPAPVVQPSTSPAQPVSVPAAPAQPARLGDLEAIKANLSVGYRAEDPSKSAGWMAASDAATKAVEGMVAYLKRPISEQLAPKELEAFFKGSNPGSVHTFDLSPNTRVISMQTRPDYQPEERAWLQWWSDPVHPQVTVLALGKWNGLMQAELFGSGTDSVLVFTTATAPTRQSTSRAVTALRFDVTQQTWVADTRAFPADFPASIGEVAITRQQDGSGVWMTRPKNPPMSNEVRLNAKGLTICDTEQVCLKLEYRNHQFVPVQS